MLYHWLPFLLHIWWYYKYLNSLALNRNTIIVTSYHTETGNLKSMVEGGKKAHTEYKLIFNSKLSSFNSFTDMVIHMPYNLPV